MENGIGGWKPCPVCTAPASALAEEVAERERWAGMDKAARDGLRRAWEAIPGASECPFPLDEAIAQIVARATTAETQRDEAIAERDLAEKRAASANHHLKVAGIANERLVAERDEAIAERDAMKAEQYDRRLRKTEAQLAETESQLTEAREQLSRLADRIQNARHYFAAKDEPSGDQAVN